MGSWVAKVRNYPHFDKPISIQAATDFVQDPNRVEKHSFYPFLRFDEAWTLYAPQGGHGDKKTRPIRYAARLDSCIFSYYRHLLSEPYEKLLAQAGLETSVIAYRRIPKAKSTGGKCNIDFALEAVQSIRDLGDCFTIALDISSFFENLDHNRIREIWGKLVCQTRLASDHYKVFEAITRYSYVDLKTAYERLGFFGQKVDRNGRTRPGYLVPKSDVPLQLCKGKVFREMIAGDGALPSIISVNNTGKGVPQGAPLSDLLANYYLLEFDKFIHEKCKQLGGRYYRYSDDILLIIPSKSIDALDLEKEVRNAIGVHAVGLDIKEKKSAVHKFENRDETQTVTVLKATKDGLPTWNKPFEYLGFRYDGSDVFIRDKTMSNLHRKIASVSKASAIRLAKRYDGKTVDEVMKTISIEKLYQSFCQVKNFDEKSDNFKNWTFSTYAKRAAKTMGPLGTKILLQLKHLRKQIKNRLHSELEKLKL